MMGVVDEDEPKQVQKARRTLQDLRVALVRAAGRMGLSAQSEAVSSLLGNLERFEKQNLPTSRKRIDVSRAAAATAAELEARDGPDSKVGLKAKVMLVGMSGTGKSELINALLERPASSTNAFRPATKGIKVVKGRNFGVEWAFIDTPGLQASADMALHNKGLLKAIRGAYKRQKPNFVIYVDRWVWVCGCGRGGVQGSGGWAREETSDCVSTVDRA
jgi:ribosome biogenesis GTPase A